MYVNSSQSEDTYIDFNIWCAATGFFYILAYLYSLVMQVLAVANVYRYGPGVLTILQI